MSSIGLEIRPQSACTIFRALLPSANYLLSDLVGCGSPLEIVLAVWHTFFQFDARQTTIIVCSGLPHQIQQVQILKKCVNDHYSPICSGQLYPTVWPTEDTSQYFCQGQRNPLNVDILHCIFSSSLRIPFDISLNRQMSFPKFSRFFINS